MNQTFKDRFLEISNCERCGNDLNGRIMSFFKEQTICLKCSTKEDKIKQKLREQGKDPMEFEGCGYIPEVEV